MYMSVYNSFLCVLLHKIHSTAHARTAPVRSQHEAQFAVVRGWCMQQHAPVADSDAPEVGTCAWRSSSSLLRCCRSPVAVGTPYMRRQNG